MQSNDYLELTKVEGKFKTDNIWIFLEADKGIFSQSTNVIQLRDNIMFFTENGESFKSDKATFDMKNDILEENPLKEKNLDVNEKLIKEKLSKEVSKFPSLPILN